MLKSSISTIISFNISFEDINNMQIVLCTNSAPAPSLYLSLCVHMKEYTKCFKYKWSMKTIFVDFYLYIPSATNIINCFVDELDSKWGKLAWGRCTNNNSQPFHIEITAISFLVKGHRIYLNEPKKTNREKKHEMKRMD